MILVFIHINEPSQAFQKIIFSSLIIFTLVLGKSHSYQTEIIDSSLVCHHCCGKNTTPPLFDLFTSNKVDPFYKKKKSKHILGFLFS